MTQFQRLIDDDYPLPPASLQPHPWKQQNNQTIDVQKTTKTSSDNIGSFLYCVQGPFYLQKVS